MKHIGFIIVDTYRVILRRYPLGQLRKAKKECKAMNYGISQKPYSVEYLYKITTKEQ